MRIYIETLLVNFAEIRIVLDQLRTLVREDEYVDEATRAKLDQVAQALRESDESFHSPKHDPHRDYVAEMPDQKRRQPGNPRVDIEGEEAEAQAHQDWSNDE